MRLEPVAADLSGEWGSVAVTSANALTATADNAALARLRSLALFTVGRRTAAAAQNFADVHSADGDVHDLVRLIAREHRSGRILYLAGEDRSADLVAELERHGVTAEMRIVYRAVTAPYPPHLTDALQAGSADAALHFSRRSAENYVAGARGAGIENAALGVRHFCLSRQVAEPLIAAGAERVEIAPQPEESALLALLDSSAG
jgi:uroporphyrinogen-III synthase